MTGAVVAALVAVPLMLGAAATPSTAGHVVFTIRDPAITEASALVPLSGGLFATTNDSGDTGRVFVLDAHGVTVGVTRWEAHPTDVESLAPAPDGELWVGDTGGNVEARSTVEVSKIPVGRGTRTVTPTLYPLTYPDGGHDAETLLCDPASGRLYVATKGLLGGHLYAAPRHLSPSGPNRLTEVAPVLPMATDGGFLPDGRHVIIRNYLGAMVYRWPSMAPVATFALPPQPQGEGIGFSAGGALYVSSEGRDSQVLRVPLPPAVAALVDPAAGDEGRAGARAGAPGGGGVQRTEVTSPHAARWPWALAGVAGVAALGVIGVVLRAGSGLRRRRRG